MDVWHGAQNSSYMSKMDNNTSELRSKQMLSKEGAKNKAQGPSL